MTVWSADELRDFLSSIEDLEWYVPIFLAACLVTRAVRFFLVAWLFKTFGPTLAPVIEKRIGLFMLLFVVILVGGFAAAALLH